MAEDAHREALVDKAQLEALLSKIGATTDTTIVIYGDNNNPFAAWFFLFSIVVCVVASLLTPAPKPEQIAGLTFSTLTEEQKASNRGSYSMGDIVVSLAILAVVAYVMISFRG